MERTGWWFNFNKSFDLSNHLISGIRSLPDLGSNILGSPGQGEGNFEIGRILHLKSEIPRSQIERASLNVQQSNLSFRDFGFEMQDSSNFKSPGVW